jgi:hypothetical protein
MENSFMHFGKYMRCVVHAVAITLFAIQAAQQAFAAAPPTYIFSTFTGDHANEMLLRIYTSADGTNFTLYADTGYGGPTGSLRDPSIMKYNGRYYVVFTAPPYNQPYANQNFVGLAWSTNLQTWNTMPSIYTTNIPGVKLSWAPEWVVGSSGLPEFTVNCSSASSDLRPYLYTATSSGLTNWSGPVDIGIGSMYLDTQVLKVGDTWHCFTKSNLLQHATAPSITGPWTWLPNNTNWANLEGPCAVQLTNGSWMMFVDPMYDVAQYLTSPDLTNWSPLIYLPGPGISIVKHGTVIRDDAFNLPPAGLTATSGNSSVTLQWNVFAGAASYNVKRSLTSGGPYTLIANVTGTSFTDTNVTNNGTYYYVLSMIYGGSESPDSAVVTATPSVGYGAADGLVAYWPFNASTGTLAVDASGNTNTATLAGGASWTSGMVSNAVSLDGSTGYVNCPTNLLNGLTNFTIAAWVKPASISTWARIFDFGSSTKSYMFLAPQSGGGALRFAITTNNNSNEQQINGAAPLPANVWTHVAVALSGGVGTLYTNGVVVGVNNGMTLNPTSLGNTAINQIGKSKFNDPFFNGQVDEFRIYNHALTASEISTLVYLPAVPTGLTAVAGDGQAMLTWSGAANAWGYNVKGSATDGGPYTVLVTNLQATAFTCSGLTNGTLYYFVVPATNALGESVNSGQASVRPVSLVPPRMDLGISDSQLWLDWPADHIGWRLQMVTNLIATNWLDIFATDVTNWVALSTTNGSRFFRLIYP